MAKRPTKRCSTSPVVRETQMETAVRSRCTPTDSVRDRGEGGSSREGRPHAHCWGCKLVPPLWKTAWRVPPKLKRAPERPSSPSRYSSKDKHQLEKRPPCPLQAVRNGRDVGTTGLSFARRLGRRRGSHTGRNSTGREERRPRCSRQHGWT